MSSPVAQRPTALPLDLWAQLQGWSATHEPALAAELAEVFISWLDGRSADDLTELLDALRELGAYPISLAVLEAAWSADLPLAQLGRIAEDWLGTVLHGLGDRAGVAEVAQFLTPRALELSPALAGDIGHLLLGWGLHEAAAPLIEGAAPKLMGDMATVYNLGIVRKHQGRWLEARAAFERVLQHQDERAAHWNLGIVCTALGDWAAARTQWQAIGVPVPAGEGPFRAPPESTPLRLPTGPGATAPFEIVWASRIGPARAVIEGFPRFPALGNHADVVLIDGAPVSKIGDEPVFAPLAVLTPSNTEVVSLSFRGDPAAADALAASLTLGGFPATCWPSLPGDLGPVLAVACSTRAALLVALEGPLAHPGLVLSELVEGTA